MCRQDRAPVLYSFRRCPYAMRARFCLAYAGIAVEHREVALKDMPEPMLRISPKATVPVMQLPSGEVLEESLDIMRWALSQSDPDGWLTADPHRTQLLIDENDGPFKQHLDQYKYHNRYPEHPREHYQAKAAEFLQKLDSLLEANNGLGLVRTSGSLADAAIFPFVRQFAGVDPEWFSIAPFPALKAWLKSYIGSAPFKSIMKKRAVWNPEDNPEIEHWSPAD